MVWYYLLHRAELFAKLYHFTQQLTREILDISEDASFAVSLSTCSGAYHSDGDFLFFLTGNCDCSVCENTLVLPFL